MRPFHLTGSNTGSSTGASALGAPGSSLRVVLTWTPAGGIACGGVVVGVLTVSGAVSPGFQLLAAPVLFAFGAALGFAHGCVLGVVGRPDCMGCGKALRRSAVGGLLALPLVAAAWVVTAGMSLTAALVRDFRPGVFVLSGGAWLLGLALCGWAGMEGVVAVQRALRRWPQRRLGSTLTGAALVVVAGLFLRYPPQLVGTDLRLTGLGALVLAAVVTLWIVLPLVVLVLHVAHDRLMPDSGGRR